MRPRRFLGAVIWEKVEGIEALSVEYWNLRKLIKERDDVRARLVACQERLDRAHEERANLLNAAPEMNQELLDERMACSPSSRNSPRSATRSSRMPAKSAAPTSASK